MNQYAAADTSFGWIADLRCNAPGKRFLIELNSLMYHQSAISVPEPQDWVHDKSKIKSIYK